ncbi:MAG: cob(I)yrinic acid a,c-diamide adenosyltransferase [Deltaproteobacteria bacterium]|jgi:cob(I)alamin adenosyltransferase|nr:cob(I)yrinic acid a,c-diamide adenosyltransferase [Deltaproteobacteria bacterium]MBW2536424.1 cob(I)yrinic acid a,c-diamide adenosyltransferase [Deltaproteobacteria bacterium]
MAGASSTPPASAGPDDGQADRGPVGAQAVYTRTGDAGQTGLRGGQRVDKHDLRVEAYGTVDELNTHVGWARELARQSSDTPGMAELCEQLLGVQHMLFNLGSALASLPEDLPPTQRRATAEDVESLEREMDRRSRDLEPLTTFVLPGGSPLNAALHVARTVCRRAERRCVELSSQGPVDPLSTRYLNRLSDTLFVWARWAAQADGATETVWDPSR